MKHWLATVLAASLAAASPHGLAQEEGASDAAATNIRWPIPWRAGMVLRYETENLEAETRPGKREKTRITDTTTLTIVEATTSGFVQRWTSGKPTIEVIEGDKDAAAMMEGLYASLAGLHVLVELDKDANYKGIRNLDEIVQQLRAAIRPMLLSAIDAEAHKSAAGDEGAREAVKAEARKRAEQVIDGFASPAFVEAAMGQVIQNYNGFIGIELEDGAAYELETELDNPLGATKFPAKLTYGLYASEDDPEDVFVEWTSTIDPRRGAAAAWEMVEKLYGTAIPKEQRKELPKEMAIEDAGFLVFNRSTGVIEMYENERKVTMKDVHKVDRDRMRLLDSDHGHTWKEEPAGEDAAKASAPAG